MSISIYKVLFVGDGKVGKTTYLHYLASKSPHDFITDYHPTLGIEVRPIRFRLQTKTGNKTIELDIWDCAGVEEYRGLFDAYCSGAQGVVYFIDSTKTKEEKEISLRKWQNEVNKVHPNLPYVVVYTKIDLVPHGIPLGTADHNSTFYEISTKTKANIQLPMMSLIAKLLHTEVNLHLTLY